MRLFSVGLLTALCSMFVLSAASGTEAILPTSSDFARAIRTDDSATLQRLVLIPGAVNVSDNLKGTPLHYAAIYGSPGGLRILLKAGADPNARNAGGATPLIYAAWSLARTRLLVEKGGDINAAQKDGTTALMVAASVHGNIATVRYLIEKGANVGALDSFGGSALLRSSSMSDPDVLRLLIAKGADPRTADAAGFNALHNVTTFPDSERVGLLLAAGTDPNGVNKFGGTVKKGPIALVHLSPLMLAACSGNPESVAAMLKAGARVNELDIRKMSPLMLSIATDHANPAVVRRLIDVGADVNAKDQNGESVLTWARKYRNPEILSMLQSAGAQGEELPAAPQPGPGMQAGTAQEAVMRAMPLLARSGPRFFNESGCSGCHHQPLQASAFAAASRAGLNPDPSLRKNFLDSMLAVRPRIVSILPSLAPPPGDYDVLLSYLVSLADLAEAPNESTDLMVHYLAVRQDPAGAWFALGISRAPIEESTITRTALAIRALKVYDWPARNAEFTERIERARRWLENSTPVTTYEWADKITGLRAAGATVASLRSEASQLLQLQRVDGGWAQTPFLDSDAYATGITLSSLYSAGLLSPDDPSYRKGADFLRRTQFPDGSWYVRSRAPKFQPYFQSGFPFDHDQWISSAATSLAVMALAPAAGPSRMAQVSTRPQFSIQ